MSFSKAILVATKKTNKAVWIAAAIVPGGLIAIVMWFLFKGTYSKIRGKND